MLEEFVLLKRESEAALDTVNQFASKVEVILEEAVGTLPSKLDSLVTEKVKQDDFWSDRAAESVRRIDLSVKRAVAELSMDSRIAEVEVSLASKVPSDALEDLLC